jgi:hypothetical protein
MARWEDGGVRRRNGAIEASGAEGIRRGTFLAIGDGEEADVVYVRSVHGTTLRVGRRRWYHRLAAWLLRLWDRVRRLASDVAWSAREFACGLRGHRITPPGEDCWCTKCWIDSDGNVRRPEDFAG